MHKPVVGKHACRTLGMCGLALINVAMFLHPMSPENFVEQLLDNPLSMLFDASGGMTTLVFWIGVLIFLAGVGGLFQRWNPFNRESPASSTPLGAPIR